MKKTVLILSMIALSLCGATAEDDGYFLSFSQKGELIYSGRIKDEAGTVYDVRICPGYEYPVRYGWNNIKEAGGNLSEYFERKKYESMFDNSGDCLEWGLEDCLWDFALEGSVKAWGRNFSAAGKRVEKRVFGYWMAYPYALLKSTVDNVVRIPVGLAGAVIGVGSGVAVVPAYHLTDSAVKAAWNGPVEGVVLPVSGLAWNTVASPPLALTGQKPSKERVDGFWVRVVPDGYKPGRKPGGRQIGEVAELGILLRKRTHKYDAERKKMRDEHNAKVRGMYDAIKKEREAHQKIMTATYEKQRAEVKEALKTDECSELREAVKGYNWSVKLMREHRVRIQEVLKEKGIDAAEASQIYDLLLNNAEAVNGLPGELTAEPQKRDPVTESIETIKAID